ncbi:MAG: glutamine amidotransferase [Candidatus Promineifilaceae bacterium]|nr:glutamine amidotransferase [Candidatus Promineifilaceae bacterium]
MKDLVILKAGDSIPSLVARHGDFEEWIIAGLGNSYPSTIVVSVHRGETPPDFDLIAGIVITGSHHPVTDRADWSERTASWLAKVVEREIPILGICFGHQILAYALGGEVDDTPAGPEFGTVSLSLTPASVDDYIFGKLPRTAAVQSAHYQSVVDLPQNATVLAFSDKDPHFAFRYGRCVWGVQFHPEFDADIAMAYIGEFTEDIERSNQDIETLLANCRDTTTGKFILRRFAQFVAKGL